MPADVPTILATSGGYRLGVRTPLEFDALVYHAVELSGVTGRRPRIAYLGTAGGDQEVSSQRVCQAARIAGFELTEVRVFPMPSLPDVAGTLLDQDVVWVGGGSVANLLALWRLHGLDVALTRAWHAGVVLAGVSAGSICWYVGGTTDSFGPDLQPVTNGLALLPYASGVHYDSEPQRRPLIHRLVADGTLPQAHCTDDGVGLVYHDTTLSEAVASRPGCAAYLVTRDGDDAREERLEPRLLEL